MDFAVLYDEAIVVYESPVAKYLQNGQHKHYIGVVYMTLSALTPAPHI